MTVGQAAGIEPGGDALVFTVGLDLRPALDRVAAEGAAFEPDVLTPEAVGRLSAEVAAGPVRPYREQFGQVRQQIEGFDVDAPYVGFPRIGELCRALSTLVREQGSGIHGLSGWHVNEAGVVLYRPGSIGITPHLDGKRYRRLVAVVTLWGSAELNICRDRAGGVMTTFLASARSLTLLRGPGLAFARDGRPFHSVSTPRAGERCAIGLRMTTSRRETPRP